MVWCERSRKLVRRFVGNLQNRQDELDGWVENQQAATAMTLMRQRVDVLNGFQQKGKEL